MTREEIRLADEKMRAEISKLIAETSRINTENTINTEKYRSEIERLHAETAKINTENQWYLLVVGSGATLAIVAIAKLFL